MDAYKAKKSSADAVEVESAGEEEDAEEDADEEED